MTDRQESIDCQRQSSPYTMLNTNQQTPIKYAYYFTDDGSQPNQIYRKTPNCIFSLDQPKKRMIIKQITDGRAITLQCDDTRTYQIGNDYRYQHNKKKFYGILPGQGVAIFADENGKNIVKINRKETKLKEYRSSSFCVVL